jgi:hypothetical protein
MLSPSLSTMLLLYALRVFVAFVVKACRHHGRGQFT